MNCKNCKHWRSTDGKTGECGLIDYLDKPYRDKPQEQPKENGFGLFVDASDDTNLCAELRTGANFGCTLFNS